MMHKDVVLAIQQSRTRILVQRLDVILSSRCWRIALVRVDAGIIGARVVALDVQHRTTRCLRRSLRWNNVSLDEFVG